MCTRRPKGFCALTAAQQQLTGDVLAPTVQSYANIKPEMDMTSEPLCKAMFDIYLVRLLPLLFDVSCTLPDSFEDVLMQGPETIVPDACKQFAKAALSLL